MEDKCSQYFDDCSEKKVTNRLKPLQDWLTVLDKHRLEDTPSKNSHLVFQPSERADKSLVWFSHKYAGPVELVSREVDSARKMHRKLSQCLSDADKDRLLCHMDLIAVKLEALLDVIEHSADNGADNESDSQKIYPENPDVLRLDTELKRPKNKGRSQNDIALEFTSGDKHRADSLLRQVRRHRNVLDELRPPLH